MHNPTRPFTNESDANWYEMETNRHERVRWGTQGYSCGRPIPGGGERLEVPGSTFPHCLEPSPSNLNLVPLRYGCLFN